MWLALLPERLQLINIITMSTDLLLTDQPVETLMVHIAEQIHFTIALPVEVSHVQIKSRAVFSLT